MTPANRDRFFRWIFPTASAVLGFAAGFIAIGTKSGMAEARADEIAREVDVLKADRRADHDILVRIEERVKALSEAKMADTELLKAIMSKRGGLSAEELAVLVKTIADQMKTTGR